ncbi:hypothetical protein, partial [Peribacillus simplex]|uniref:hypothetical protein n=1 Tax=Peribacillus simplex TaxID=1478 RepID=UPI00333909FB
MFQRIGKIMVVLSLVMSFVLVNSTAIFASTDIDTTKPTIKSIKLDKDTVEPGGQMPVQVEAEDLESGVKQVYVKLKRAVGGVESTIFLTYNEKIQRYEGTYNVPSNAGNGKWELFFIYANDKAGNEYYTSIKEGSELYRTFTVTGGFDDTTKPTIKSTKIDKETVQAGGQVGIQV